MGGCTSKEPRHLTKVLPDAGTMMPDILRTRFVPPSTPPPADARPAAACPAGRSRSPLETSGSRRGCSRGDLCMSARAVKHVSHSNPWLPLLTPHQLVEIAGAFKKFGAPRPAGSLALSGRRAAAAGPPPPPPPGAAAFWRRGRPSGEGRLARAAHSAHSARRTPPPARVRAQPLCSAAACAPRDMARRGCCGAPD